MTAQVRHHRYFKKMPVTISVLAIIIMAGSSALVFHHRALIFPAGKKQIEPYRSAGPQLEIRGFRFNRNVENRRVASITADRLIVEKKKLGFFKFSLLNEATFENTVIKIYGKRRTTDTSDQFEDDPLKGLTFDEAFSKETFSSIPVKRVSSMVMTPIHIEIHDEQSMVASISAGSATVRFARRHLLFDHNVKVVSGDRVLTTDQLYLVTDKAMLQAKGHFVLKVADKQLEGHGLITDVFLNPLDSKENT